MTARCLTIGAALYLACSVCGALGSATAADLPIFDAHLHYSHDAWDTVPPKEAIAILRKAGVRGAVSNLCGTQRKRVNAREP